jgi:hypothetical protein
MNGNDVETKRVGRNHFQIWEKSAFIGEVKKEKEELTWRWKILGQAGWTVSHMSLPDAVDHMLSEVLGG